jgi:hypothetical protein
MILTCGTIAIASSSRGPGPKRSRGWQSDSVPLGRPAVDWSMSPSAASYTASRDALVAELRRDAAAHRAGASDEVGRHFDAVERHFPHGTAPELGRLHIALTFWDGWVDARNHGWPRGPVSEADWPRLADLVADDLAADRDISDPTVLARFDLVRHPGLNERVQTLAARLRAREDDDHPPAPTPFR